MNLQKDKPTEEKSPEKESTQESDGVVKAEQSDISSTEQKDTNSVATSETAKKEEEKEKESESSTADKKEVHTIFIYMISLLTFIIL